MIINGKSGLNLNFENVILCVKIKLFDEKEYMKGMFLYVYYRIDR